MIHDFKVPDEVTLSASTDLCVQRVLDLVLFFFFLVFVFFFFKQKTAYEM